MAHWSTIYLPMQEMWVRSLGQEDPLEEKNANALQYSCLGNSMDRGAWNAIVYAVTRVRCDLATKQQYTST